MTRFQVSKISGPGCGTRKSDGSREEDIPGLKK